MAVDLQVPVRVGREPVVLVAVEHERRVVRDPPLAHQAFEGGLIDQVALDRILQVIAPMKLDCARDVALLVEIGVLVDLGDDDAVVVQVLGQPVCRHQHRLRVSVLRHSPSLYFRK